VAATRANVLIRGEQHRQELIARAIDHSRERAALRANQLAQCRRPARSDLFGVRGAFTGAGGSRGKFALAGRGAIFLDEIGDTSADFQTKLLRVLQERQFYPVGADRPERTEARVIAATNRDLEAMVAAGQFRADLYYRLRVVEIVVPPLRERAGDLPLLAATLVRRSAAAVGRPEPVLAPDALAAIARHAWPGNVRELENCLTRAVVVASGDVIRAEHLVLGSAAPEGPGSSARSTSWSASTCFACSPPRAATKRARHRSSASRVLGSTAFSRGTASAPMADTTTARLAPEAQSRRSPPATPAAPVASVTSVLGAVPDPSSTAVRPVRRSIRTQLILVVLAAALVPLALLALWLARASGRAGETLLTARLDAAVLSAASEAGVRWVEHRSSLLDLADVVEVRRALGDTVGAVSAPAVLPAAVRLAIVRDAAGAVRWARAADTATTRGVFRPVLTLWSRSAAGAIGSLEAVFPGSAIVGRRLRRGHHARCLDRRTGCPSSRRRSTPTWPARPRSPGMASGGWSRAARWTNPLSRSSPRHPWRTTRLPSPTRRGAVWSRCSSLEC
jgi:hypothetical protein